MDTKIENGDMVTDSTGSAVYITDKEEIIQRALFCITTRKGGFIYNKSMGAEAVTSVVTERDQKNLEARFREAVAAVEGLELYLKCAEELIDGTIKAEITLVYKGEEIHKEVILDGEL